MPVYAVTGMICSGKSVLLRELKKKGARIFDSDRVVHAHYRNPDSPLCRKVAALFPESASENRTIVRARLADIVLKDKAKLAALEKIVHPAVISDLKAWMKKARRQEGIFLAEVPLLFEKDLSDLFDAVIFVRAPKHLLAERIKEKFSLSRAKAEQRIGLMSGSKEKERKSHFVLNNDSDINEFKKNIDRLWKQLKSQKKKEVKT